MKIKNKGKVHPSPLHHHLHNSSSNAEDVVVSVMKLLPTTILALASVLSLQDREVLAYMITRSLQTTTMTSTKTLETSRKRTAASKRASSTASAHKPPFFDCDCFDCYTSYWLRWDSSRNRELIHQAIEAFEDHLFSGERNKKNSRAKRREKTLRTARRVQPPEGIVIPTVAESEIGSSSMEMAEKMEESNVPLPVRFQEAREVKREEVNEEEVVAVAEAVKHVEEVEVVANSVPVIGGGGGGSPAANSHKGLARKVLPDVLGILNSRLWNLWNPNV